VKRIFPFSNFYVIRYFKDFKSKIFIILYTYYEGRNEKR